MVIALCTFHLYQLGQEYSGVSDVISIGGPSTSVIPIGGWLAWLPYASLHLPVRETRSLWQEIHCIFLEIWREMTETQPDSHPPFSGFR